MRKHLFVSMLMFAALSTAASAQWTSVGIAKGVKKLDNGIAFRATVGASSSTVTIEALSSDVLRIRYSTPGVASQPHASLAVIGLDQFPRAPLNFDDQQAGFSTSSLRVRISNDGRIVISNSAGEVICEDARSVAFDGKAFRVYKSMPKDEHYFGLGDKAGPIDHRDQAFTMWDTDAYGWHFGTDPLYKSIPFFMGLRKGAAYGIYLDNTYRTSFDFGKQTRDQYSFGSDGGDLDYYFFYGPDPKRVLENYTALVGRTPLPPLWILGYQQSRYSYETEARVREVAAEFRKRKIPADVLYLDIDYEDGRRPFTINRKTFPHFEEMVRDLAAQGFNLVPIVDLHLKKEPGYKPYDEGMKGDHFVKNADGSVYVGEVWPGPSVFPDFTRTASRDWWGSLFADFCAMGIRGIWNDMNEPAVFTYPDKTMPLNVVHRVENDHEHRTTDHREIHNVFGSENARGTYDGLLRCHPNQRPFVLTRAGFAGTWRWAATWTGDNTSTWEHYRLTIPTLLSLGVSGYTFAGADTGGFSGSPTPELLTRWLELSAFTPFYRDHTDIHTKDQEPWAHGAEQEAIRRRYIELRYRLLPYIYTGMELASRTGLPLMRPIFLEYPNAGDVAFSDKEFLFGRDLLVAPKVLETLDAYEVELPKGEWYDFWTGRPVRSDAKFKVEPALDTVPIYVRAGAIIPMQPVVQSTAEKPNGPLEIRVYSGPSCEGWLYQDDGSSFDYAKGNFFRAEFTCKASGGEVRVNTRVTSSKYQPWFTEVKYTVMGVSQPPASVTVDGNAVTSIYDANAQAVTFTISAARLADEVVVH